MERQSHVWAGGNIVYSIWVWSTVSARAVTATASVHGRAARAPRFTLCPAAHRRTCSIGDLSANQAIEVLVTNHIRKTAAVGDQITLTVTVEGAGLSPAEAAITAVVGAGTSPATTSPPSSIPAPPYPVVLPGPTLTPNSLNTLFPTVTPGSTPSPTANRKGRVTAATPTSSTLPLDPRLIGGQLAGLAVLAAAVTLVVARLSLRQAAPAAPGAPTAPGAPADPSLSAGEAAVDPDDDHAADES